MCAVCALCHAKRYLPVAGPTISRDPPNPQRAGTGGPGVTLGSRAMATEQTAAVCLDVGSTWTKAALVRPDGTLAGFAEHPTTVGDVLAGMDAAVRAVSAAAPVGPAGAPELLACSSAGGGLRLAVVGSERLASTDAGHRVACSAGAHVVHVHAGLLEPADVRLLRSTRPGVVLLLGGPDGGDPAALLHNAGRLARARIRYPVLLAGNTEARADAEALLRATGRTVLVCDNVTPRRGEVVPGPARAVLVELYERHVLGGRGPAVAPRFRRLVRSPTTDAVQRAAVELARICGCAVLIIDIGSATTDVHSVPAGPDAIARSTVEGDLGVRSAAGGVLVEGQTEGLVDPVEADLLGPTVKRMTGEVGYLPKDTGSAAEDRRIAALAGLIATRRHFRAHPDAAHDIGLVVLSGGVLRQRDTARGLGAVASTLSADPVLATALSGVPILIDADFAIPPAGMLAAHERSDAAQALLRNHLLDSGT
jgi:ADP-dependent NAD(P)H-hydrate dehydratase / NAD(P)H-hydrate epimerase